jgi:hypothetical protein
MYTFLFIGCPWRESDCSGWPRSRGEDIRTRLDEALQSARWQGIVQMRVVYFFLFFFIFLFSGCSAWEEMVEALKRHELQTTTTTEKKYSRRKSKGHSLGQAE